MRKSDLAARFLVHAIELVLSETVLVMVIGNVQPTVSDPSKNGQNHRNIEEYPVFGN